VAKVGGPSLGWQVWGLPLSMLCFGTLGCSDAQHTGTAGGGVKVAGCTVEGAGSVSITDAAGAALFPATDAGSGGGTTPPPAPPCSGNLPVGTKLRMTAMPIDNFAFSEWRSGFQQSAGIECPCVRSTDPDCAFTVQTEAYCGAVFAAP